MDIRKYRKKFKQFGYWGNSRIGTEFPCVAAGLKGAEYERPYLDPLTDEEGELIDKGLLLLRNLDLDLFEVFVLTYVARKGIEILKAQFGKSQYYVKLNAAESFMIGFLCARGKVIFY